MGCAKRGRSRSNSYQGWMHSSFAKPSRITARLGSVLNVEKSSVSEFISKLRQFESSMKVVGNNYVIVRTKIVPVLVTDNCTHNTKAH